MESCCKSQIVLRFHYNHDLVMTALGCHILFGGAVDRYHMSQNKNSTLPSSTNLHLKKNTNPFFNPFMFLHNFNIPFGTTSNKSYQKLCCSVVLDYMYLKTNNIQKYSDTYNFQTYFQSAIDHISFKEVEFCSII